MLAERFSRFATGLNYPHTEKVNLANVISWVAVALILARMAAELWLSRLNRRHVLAHAGAVPEAFRGVVDESTYKKSVEYTLAKAGFGNIEEVYSTIVLLVILFSGVLPFGLHFFENHLGGSAWAMAAFLFAVGFGISNAEHVKAVGEFADAAIIGSALVALIEKSEPSEAAGAVGRFIAGLQV